MNLQNLILRNLPPDPWSEGDHIPWNDPQFSERMLREHLSQAHDAASRRLGTIGQHVQWIHTDLLASRPARVLDLACGPGLYTSRLARLGHTCTGIDFSPASIRFARQEAASAHLPCAYQLEDLRQADFDQHEPYDLAMLIYGEFNAFRPADAAGILHKTFLALKPGGVLLLEPHPFEAIQKIGQKPPTWRTMQAGLFSNRPHLYLEESFWDTGLRAATNRYWVIDGETGQVTRYASSYQAYTHDEYRFLLEQHHFGDIDFYPSLGGKPGDPDTDLIAITAQKEHGREYPS